VSREGFEGKAEGLAKYQLRTANYEFGVGRW
jgi:hypothetical protein